MRTPADDRGAILLHVLMFMGLVTAIASGVAILARMETMVAAHFRQRREMGAAAAAGAEIAIQVLRGVPDWSGVLAGTSRLPSSEGAVTDVRTIGGRTGRICCGAGSRTAELVTESGVGWVPWGWARFETMAGTPSPAAAFIVVWAADDEGEVDGDPAADSNGILRLHVEAIAPSGARRVVESSIDRGSGPPPFPRILVWREW